MVFVMGLSLAYCLGVLLVVKEIENLVCINLFVSLLSMDL